MCKIAHYSKKKTITFTNFKLLAFKNILFYNLLFYILLFYNQILCFIIFIFSKYEKKINLYFTKR